MTFFVTSLLQLPLKLIGNLYPAVKNYYGNDYSKTDAYEHFYTGFIVTLLSGYIPLLTIKLSLILIAFVIHVVVKEIIYDMFVLKKKFNKVDFVLRIFGFLFASPFLFLK